MSSHSIIAQSHPTTSDDARDIATTDDFISVLLSIAKRTRAMFGLKLAEVGLHVGQDQLLQSLGSGQPVTVSALAEALDVRPSTVSKMVDRLTERAMVERLGDGHDARRTMIRITADGLKAKAQVQTIWDAVQTDLTRSIGGDVSDLTRELRNLDQHLAARLMRLR